MYWKIRENLFFAERENPLEYERTLIESLVLLKSQEALKSLRDEAIKEFKLPISTYNDYKKYFKSICSRCVFGNAT